MQGFNFQIQYIPGTKMGLADYLSRMYAPTDSDIGVLDMFEDEDLPEDAYMDVLVSVATGPWRSDKQSASEDGVEYVNLAHLVEQREATNLTNPTNFCRMYDYDDPQNPEYYISRSHAGLEGKAHHGVRRTWDLLNKEYPGHRIPHKKVIDFVTECPTCQKERIGMVDQIKPLIKHLKPEHHRKAIGFDTLTVTPPDDYENQYVDVIVDHYIKHCQLYPYPTHDAMTTATSLFSYLMTWGRYDKVYCDPGSDLTSDTVKELIAKWMGSDQVISIVDRHQSNGVEGTNKQILRHLRALVHDERMKNKWSHPSILKMIEWIINSVDNSEVGITPIHARFGTDAATWFQMPENLAPGEYCTKYCQFLDENLRIIREITKKHQDEIVAKRTAENDPARQNQYQPGDFILFKPNTPFAESKLSPLFKGPYEVIRQVDNDIECIHVATRIVSKFHVDTVKIFHGDAEDALRQAMVDKDQYKVKGIRGYRGNPMKRTSCEFLTEFEDGDIIWKPFDRDLYDTIAYEEFCKSRPELMFLHLPYRLATQSMKQWNRTPITEVIPGDKVFVDIRFMGSFWYDNLHLPNGETLRYVLEMEYTEYPRRSQRNHLSINIHSEFYNRDYENLNHCWVLMWGCHKTFNTNDMVKVNQALGRRFPHLLTDEYVIRGDPVGHQQQTVFSPMIPPLQLPGQSLTFMSYNCNSLRKRVTCVAHLLDEFKPHILFLQETKCDNKLFPATLKQHANYQHYICGEPQFNGVATLSTIPATDVLYAIPNYHDSMYRYMELTISGIRFINIYAPQGQALGSTAYSSKVIFYQKLLERLHALLANNIIPFIVGDFNIIPSDLDLYNPTSTEWQTNAMCSPAERHWFQQILKLGYTDLFAHYYSDIRRPFTWWPDRQAYTQNHGWRIDHFLVPTVYLPYAQCPLVHHDFRLAEYAAEKPSDHAPISLTITLSSISYLTGREEDGH
jgi:exodeoxyribonuclease-3